MFGLDFISSIVSGILTPLTSMFTKAQDVSLEKYKVDGTVDVTLIAADTARLQAQKELAIAGEQYKGERYLRYLFGYPAGIWFAFYMYDSTFRSALPPGWTWRVLTPEPAVMEFITWIVGFLFLHAIASYVKK